MRRAFRSNWSHYRITRFYLIHVITRQHICVSSLAFSKESNVYNCVGSKQIYFKEDYFAYEEENDGPLRSMFDNLALAPYLSVRGPQFNVILWLMFLGFESIFCFWRLYQKSNIHRLSTLERISWSKQCVRLSSVIPGMIQSFFLYPIVKNVIPVANGLLLFSCLMLC